MDIKTSVELELWDVIQKDYENGSYSSAILDSIHLLTETIRNKTGLEGDGSSLVGQAFGGDNPKIQLNKLQTESEKNIQKGMQDILRGLYTAIRNPRSHDKHLDTKEDADSIIYFINYILKIIDQSRVSFEESTFLKRVYDEYYVKTEEYSRLLVSEIPKRQMTNVAISVVRKRKSGDIYCLSSFMHALVENMDENEITQLYKVVSEELKYTSSDDDIRTILKIFPANHWGKIDKAVKIRIENLLKTVVEKGTYSSTNKRCRFGALGTWISLGHMQNFEDTDEWTRLVVKKIKSSDIEERDYAESYFWIPICQVNRDNINYYLESYFREGLKNNEEDIITKLNSIIMFDENHPWWKVFEEELKEHPDIIYIGDEDLPF